MFIRRKSKSGGGILVSGMIEALREITGYTEEQMSRTNLYNYFNFVYFGFKNSGWADECLPIPMNDDDLLYMHIEVSENIFVYKVAAMMCKKMGDTDKADEFEALANEGFKKYASLKR